jgi:hypothetical protein
LIGGRALEDVIHAIDHEQLRLGLRLARVSVADGNLRVERP